MSRSCSCGGNNENCMFCYGTGTIDVPRQAASLIRRPVRPTTKCPICGLDVQRLRRHFNKVHPVQSEVLPPPRTSATTANVASAPKVTSLPQLLKKQSEPEATAVVRRSDAPHPNRTADATSGAGPVPSTKSLRLAARGNIAYYHGLEGRQPATPKRINASKSVAIPRTNRPLVKCTRCPNPVLVREDHMARHLRKCHGVLGERPMISGTTTPVPAQKTRGRKPQPAPSNIKRTTESPRGGVETVGGFMSSDCDERPNEIDNHRIERRLDGSRDYWQIREEGRFGSHPSFDSCDDESAP